MLNLFLIYQFIRRLVTPFSEWDAFKLGIIDERGKVLRKRRQLRTKEEKDAFGVFDVLVLNLKKLLEKLPAGQTKLASYAAALWLIREYKAFTPDSMLTEDMSDEKIQESIDEFFSGYTDYILLENSVNKKDHNLNNLFEERFQIDELFDKPSSFKKTVDKKDVISYKSFIRGKTIEIDFDLLDKISDLWELSFYVDGSTDITGEGDEYKVFSTVLAATKDFISEKEPKNIIFSSLEKNPFTGKISMSRKNLYTRLVKRFAADNGYALKVDSNLKRDEDSTTFKLTRIVSEDAPTNNIGSGVVSGLTADDEPGITKKQQLKYKKRNKKKNLRNIMGDIS